MAFSFDTTLGLALTIGLHRAALAGARWYGARRGGSAGAAHAHSGADEAGEPAAPGGSASAAATPWWQVLQACGSYGEPPSVRRWALQAAEWVACVVAARALCGTLVVLLGPALAHVALVRLGWLWGLGTHPQLQQGKHTTGCRRRIPCTRRGPSRWHHAPPCLAAARLRRAWTARSAGTPRCCSTL